MAWVPAVGMWLATRWEEAIEVASDPERFAADMPGSPLDRSFGSPTILTSDGPVHKGLRQGFSARLRPAAVEAFVDALVAPIAEEHLDALLAPGRDDAELMAEYFEPVSVLGLGALLGLGDLDAGTLRRWFAGLAEGATNFERDPSKQAVNDAVCAEIDRELGPRLQRLAAEGDDSLLSHLLHEGLEAGSSRAPEEVMPTLKVTLLGGMQEPGHGAGTVLFALLSHPEQLAAVRADLDTALPVAIEEGMRWIAPIGTQGRRTTRALELAGVALPADAPVAAVLASANRDEERFEHAERFDVDRPRQRTATFGFGPHFCSGHAFARALERIALRRLLERLGDLRLDPERATVFAGWEFRAPRTLPVRWG